MKIIFLSFLSLISLVVLGQRGLNWTPDGNAYYRIEGSEIVKYTLPDQTKSVLVTQQQLTAPGQTSPLSVRSFVMSDDGKKILIFTNTQRVWRYDTRGDYWLLDTQKNTLKQLGKGRPSASLMFAKLSPDAQKVAYVSEQNLYVEDAITNKITQLTKDGTSRVINGTFDWVYEEEFDCRDGFRWSPDSKALMYWQIDASKIRNFLMINNTDSTYSFTVPVEYPKVGEMPSPYRIGVVNIATAQTRWMKTPDDPRQSYIPRGEWSGTNELILQQLNRKQNTSKLLKVNTLTGATTAFYTESDEAWIDIKNSWTYGTTPVGWDWLDDGKEFLWISEKDGWRHLYRVSADGKSEKCITLGEYDVISLSLIDKKNNYVYFMASPNNATQSYLYRVPLDGNGSLERVSPEAQAGTHSYDLSPNGAFAMHSFSNANTVPMREWLKMPDHTAFKEAEDITKKLAKAPKSEKSVEFFKIKTEDGIELDGWMVKPTNFDPSKKYPILFNVYTEPAASTVKDSWGTGRTNLYKGDLAKDGYIYASIDNRGTPMPRGRAWRKAIYRNIGRINIRDVAMGAKAMFRQYAFIDTARVAVHGWSGGGSSTLNLLFQYPDIFKTGIAVAAVADQLSYDNIYQERYMGIPQENKHDFVQGSPMTHAKNLRGNLLYIHGTGDDNVHYQNAEKLVNELIKHNKQFQFMPYPNRSHSISEGVGTTLHLSTLFTNYLRQHCVGGGR